MIDVIFLGVMMRSWIPWTFLRWVLRPVCLRLPRLPHIWQFHLLGVLATPPGVIFLDIFLLGVTNATLSAPPSSSDVARSIVSTSSPKESWGGEGGGLSSPPAISCCSVTASPTEVSWRGLLRALKRTSQNRGEKSVLNFLIKLILPSSSMMKFASSNVCSHFNFLIGTPC